MLRAILSISMIVTDRVNLSNKKGSLY